VVFVGGEARQRHLGEHVARVLRLPARAVDPLARIVRTGKEPSIGVDFSEAQPGWALPLGLCVSRTDL
jgi:Tfp pilus assembly PilM family ATPase